MKAEKVRNYALSDVASLRERLAAAHTREAELIFDVLVAFDQVERATVELNQASKLILKQSEELGSVAVLNHF